MAGASCKSREQKDGYFMIRRGTNMCGIERDAVAGVPSTRNLARAVASASAITYASY